MDWQIVANAVVFILVIAIILPCLVSAAARFSNFRPIGSITLRHKKDEKRHVFLNTKSTIRTMIYLIVAQFIVITILLISNL